MQPEAEQHRNCIRCGRPNRVNSTYCVHCGANQPFALSSNATTSTGKSGLRTGCLVATILAGVLGGAAVIASILLVFWGTGLDEGWELGEFPTYPTLEPTAAMERDITNTAVARRKNATSTAERNLSTRIAATPTGSRSPGTWLEKYRWTTEACCADAAISLSTEVWRINWSISPEHPNDSAALELNATSGGFISSVNPSTGGGEGSKEYYGKGDFILKFKISRGEYLVTIDEFVSE